MVDCAARVNDTLNPIGALGATDIWTVISALELVFTETDCGVREYWKNSISMDDASVLTANLKVLSGPALNSTILTVVFVPLASRTNPVSFVPEIKYVWKTKYHYSQSKIVITQSFNLERVFVIVKYL